MLGMKRLFSRLAVALVTWLVCLPAFAVDRPNILWINCEDLDEVLGCYGYKQAITPNLDALAKEGILYRNAFANAPICAPARNCLITGMYPTALGGQHLRCEITLPSSIEPFPNHLKRAGYFVTNYTKTDYNFSPDGIYDYWSRDFAPWRKRKEADQPFFSFIVLGTTHEGPGNFRDRYDAATANLPKEKFHDPAKAELPPYFPDTPKMRELWARYDDLTSAMDEQVGEIIGELKKDGLWEDTIVWFFSDHGHGLPRHKRWLLDSGLRVPFLVHVPEKFQHLAPGLKPGSETDRLVSFVDFAPTVLSMAGIEVPEVLQGEPFLGETIAEPRKFIYGARDRADDMFEVSRAVHDGRYIYVRHFLPQLPYLQGGVIFGNQKESLADLRRARDAGEYTEHSWQIFGDHKPVEEFYDLKNDPHEIHNLANDPKQAKRLAGMRQELERWILEHRDTGFLTESEYHRRADAAGLSIYEMAQRQDLYDLPSAYRAATGQPLGAHSDDATLWWWIHNGDPAATTRSALSRHIHHPNPSIRVVAAKVACQNGDVDLGLPVLQEMIGAEDLVQALEASRAMFHIGVAAKPAVERIQQVRKSLENPDPNSRRRYRDFNYASFTGWALEGALINCGAAKPEDF